MKIKRKTKIRVNRIVSMALTLALILCQTTLITGCGKKELDENRDSIETVLPDGVGIEDIEDMLESGMDAGEIIDRVEEIKDGSVVTTDKPSGATESPEPTATESPAPTETSKPTATPEPTATPTPEPTAPPHVHEWAETVTREASCSGEGEKKLTCECGESKVETIPVTEHNWVENTTVVHHEALGHVEQVQVQTGTSAGYTTYACAVCGASFDTPDEVQAHKKGYLGEDNLHVTANTIATDYPGQPVYETQSQWIVDQPAWDETVGTGTYTCSVCGATK